MTSAPMANTATAIGATEPVEAVVRIALSHAGALDNSVVTIASRTEAVYDTFQIPRDRVPGADCDVLAGIAGTIRQQGVTVERKPRARKASADAGEALSTRDALVELAADLFAERGYIQTSIRDIARKGALTSGAIYGNFRNKADLLAEAINKRTREQLENQAVLDPEGSHVDTLRGLSRTYPRRRQLRALILQGAAAAETDPETRDRLKQEQLDHLDNWISGYEANRERLGIDPAVDIPTAVMYTWAAELGLGVLEALGITPTSPDSWADMAARCGRAMTLPPEGGSAKTSKNTRRRPAKR